MSNYVQEYYETRKPEEVLCSRLNAGRAMIMAVRMSPDYCQYAGEFEYEILVIEEMIYALGCTLWEMK